MVKPGIYTKKRLKTSSTERTLKNFQQRDD